jgi:hypothetical protein
MRAGARNADPGDCALCGASPLPPRLLQLPQHTESPGDLGQVAADQRFECPPNERPLCHLCPCPGPCAQLTALDLSSTACTDAAMDCLTYGRRLGAWAAAAQGAGVAQAEAAAAAYGRWAAKGVW